MGRLWSGSACQTVPFAHRTRATFRGASGASMQPALRWGSWGACLWAPAVQEGLCELAAHSVGLSAPASPAPFLPWRLPRVEAAVWKTRIGSQIPTLWVSCLFIPGRSTSLFLEKTLWTSRKRGDAGSCIWMKQICRNHTCVNRVFLEHASVAARKANIKKEPNVYRFHHQISRAQRKSSRCLLHEEVNP